MDDYVLTLDTSIWDGLDEFALLASQDYNLGNTNDWFGSFRGGFNGMVSRFIAFKIHYYEVHAWLPKLRVFGDAEYHLATAFFHMDSALECMTFALNALGNSVAPSDFRDLGDDKALRQISPFDIIGSQTRAPLPGYSRFFPNLQLILQTNATIIRQLIDQHDVSKHRQAIFGAGTVRMDPPPDFYETIGIDPKDERKIIFSPMGEILLDPNPKEPRANKATIPAGSSLRFEDLAQKFVEIFSDSAVHSLSDARTNIKLPIAKPRE